MSAPNTAGSAQKRRSALKTVAAVTAVVVGVSAASVAGTIAAYDAFFPRYERPNYALTPGMYDYERYGGTLPRESFFLPSGENLLCAYYYPVASPRALAVTVHGVHAGGDDLLPIIERLVQEGYAVLSYDATATYSSTGEDGIGMCQFMRDLDAVLNYVSVHPDFAAMPRVLVGHSLGGNAVASMLERHSEVKAAVCIAAMNDASTLMVESARKYVDDVAYLVKPVFDIYQRHLFDEFTEYNAVRGINSTTIPVLLAQGLCDEVIPHDTLAIVAHLDEITNPNVSVYYADGLQGSHTGIWHSLDAEQYAAEVKAGLDRLEEQKGRDLTDEEKAAYYRTVDHRRYSAVNEQLFAEIFATFDRGLAQ